LAYPGQIFTYARTALLVICLALGAFTSAASAQDVPVHVGPDTLYPNPALTPGAIVDDVTADQVCTLGYTKTVRNVTATERALVYAEYDLTFVPGAAEVDHFVPLELGGSNDISNLWPQPYQPSPGAREKDRVENYLHDQVCSGAIALADAQVAIESDWYAVFVALPGAPVGVADGEHTYYASTFRTADTIYCDTDPDWKSLSPRYLVSFTSLDAATAALPGYKLHRPC
jgi:hypothetical protein